MHAHELQEDGALPKPALELVAEDVGRLCLGQSAESLHEESPRL
jgi:hypothetical protein